MITLTNRTPDIRKFKTYNVHLTRKGDPISVTEIRIADERLFMQEGIYLSDASYYCNVTARNKARAIAIAKDKQTYYMSGRFYYR